MRPRVPDRRRASVPRSASPAARRALGAERNLRARLGSTDMEEALKREADSGYMAEKATEPVMQQEVDGRLQRQMPIPGRPGQYATMAVRRRRRPDPIPQAKNPQPERFPVIDPSLPADQGPAPEPVAPPVIDEQLVPAAIDDEHLSEAATDQMYPEPLPTANRPQKAVVHLGDDIARPAVAVRSVEDVRLDQAPPRAQTAAEGEGMQVVEPFSSFDENEIRITPTRFEEAETDSASGIEIDRAAGEAAYDASGREGRYNMGIGGSTFEPQNKFERSNGGAVVFAEPKERIVGESALNRNAQEAAVLQATQKIDSSTVDIFGDRDQVTEQRIDAVIGVYTSLSSNAVKLEKQYDSISGWKNPLQKLEAWNMIRRTRKIMKKYEKDYPDAMRDMRSGRQPSQQAKKMAYNQLPDSEKRAA